MCFINHIFSPVELRGEAGCRDCALRESVRGDLRCCRGRPTAVDHPLLVTKEYHLTLRLTLPEKHVKGPCEAVVQLFCNHYNKKFPEPPQGVLDSEITFRSP